MNSASPCSLRWKRGKEEVIQLLLKQGVNIEAKSKKGHTALDVTTDRGYARVVRLLEAKIKQ